MSVFTKRAPDTHTGNEKWAKALCYKYDPEMWALTGNIITPENQAALAICNRCPILDWCLKQAPRIKPRSMILGGIAFNDDGKPWHLQPNHHPRR